MNVQYSSLTIWRFTDGKPGHDSQSQGLVQALSDLTECRVEDITVPTWQYSVSGLLGLKHKPFASLPRPDLLIGAGHKTHLPLITARKFRGSKSLVLMKPSLPLSWFDLCLIPDHDHPPVRDNILVTRGPINTIRPNPDKIPGQGMILIGGPSRHYGWDSRRLLGQIRDILKAEPASQWVVADSPRTPDETSKAFHTLADHNLHYKPFSTTPRGWFTEMLAVSSTIWVTADSMSMIYEALTAGATVGILELPPENSGRLVEAVKTLTDSGQATMFETWSAGQKLAPPPMRLQESRRCALEVLERFFHSTPETR